MKDREQNIGLVGKVGRGLAAAGLLMTACGIQVNSPETRVYGPGYIIEQASDNTYNLSVDVGIRVWNETEAYWDADSFIRSRCTVDRVIQDGMKPKNYTFVVTKSNCIPEIKKFG